MLKYVACEEECSIIMIMHRLSYSATVLYKQSYMDPRKWVARRDEWQLKWTKNIGIHANGNTGSRTTGTV